MKLLSEIYHPALTAQVLQNLQNNGDIKTIPDFIASDPDLLSKMSSNLLNLDTVFKIREYLFTSHPTNVSIVASFLVKKAEKITISSGMSSLDQLLGGPGFKTDHIYEVYGPPGSGKSQLVMHLAAKNHVECLYIDTKNDFSLNRIKSMMDQKDQKDRLDKIHLAKAFDLLDLMKILEDLAKTQWYVILSHQKTAFVGKYLFR
jgi:RecA/RadA recombinase